MAGRLAGIGSETAHTASLLKSGLTKLVAIKTLLHGLSSGIINYFRGGSFRAGLFSGIGSAFDIGTKGYGTMVGRTSIMAIIVGTFAKLGGGKFANGAMSAAFVHLFNDEFDYLYLRGKGVARAMGGDGGITDKQAQTNDKITFYIVNGVSGLGEIAVLFVKYGGKLTIEIIAVSVIDGTSAIKGVKPPINPRTKPEIQIKRNIREQIEQRTNNGIKEIIEK